MRCLGLILKTQTKRARMHYEETLFVHTPCQILGEDLFLGEFFLSTLFLLDDKLATGLYADYNNLRLFLFSIACAWRRAWQTGFGESRVCFCFCRSSVSEPSCCSKGRSCAPLIRPFSVGFGSLVPGIDAVNSSNVPVWRWSWMWSQKLNTSWRRHGRTSCPMNQEAAQCST